MPNEAEREADVEVHVGVEPAAQQIALLALATSLRQQQGGDLVGDFAKTLLQHATASSAQLFQDVFALYMTNFKRGGFFVEVGTGDGHLISNTYLLEKEYGWRGIVVEPNPVFLPALEKNRECMIATECILDVSGKPVTFECAIDPEYSRIVSTDLHLRPADTRHTDRRMDEDKQLSLTTLSLNDLLSRHGLPEKIDFISIDVEGAEYHILSTFDFLRWHVGCFCIEHNWTASRLNIFELMTAHGYIRVLEHFSQWDDWYVHRSLLRENAIFASLLDAHPDRAGESSAMTFVHWSDKAIARGDLDVARVLCARALELDAVLGSAFRSLADIAQRDGKPAQAISHWRRALELDPADYWAHLGLATLLLQWGDRSEAIRLLHAARELRDDQGRAEALLMHAEGEARPQAASAGPEANGA